MATPFRCCKRMHSRLCALRSWPCGNITKWGGWSYGKMGPVHLHTRTTTLHCPNDCLAPHILTKILHTTLDWIIATRLHTPPSPHTSFYQQSHSPYLSPASISNLVLTLAPWLGRILRYLCSCHEIHSLLPLSFLFHHNRITPPPSHLLSWHIFLPSLSSPHPYRSYQGITESCLENRPFQPMVLMNSPVYDNAAGLCCLRRIASLPLAMLPLTLVNLHASHRCLNQCHPKYHHQSHHLLRYRIYHSLPNSTWSHCTFMRKTQGLCFFYLMWEYGAFFLPFPLTYSIISHPFQSTQMQPLNYSSSFHYSVHPIISRDYSYSARGIGYSCARWIASSASLWLWASLTQGDMVLQHTLVGFF